MTAGDLRGVHVALATPVGADGDLDLEGLGRLLNRVIEGGVTGICPTGSTGEGPRLTRDQRHKIATEVRAAIGSERLLLPAGSALTASDAVAEIAGLAEAGADAVLLAPPSYYPMDPAAVTAWFRAVAEQAAVPIILYNIPAMTKVALPVDSVAVLSRLPGVIGIKDSSRDFEYLQSIIYATVDDEFAVLTGSDSMLLPSLQAGAVGTIAASANLVPQLGRQIYDATNAGDLDAARTAQQRLYAVIMACRGGGVPPSGWKAALAAVGVCSADLVPPAIGMDADAQAALANRLTALGIG